MTAPPQHEGPPSTRRGTFLLLAIAIVSTLMLIAFAFVRMTALHREAGDSQNRALLAKEAARYGLNHAIEELLRDHMAEPPTRLDGSGRAQFIAFSQPYFVDGNTPDDVADRWTLNRDDTPLESSLWNTFASGWGVFTSGLYTNEGRGRFREPEFAEPAVVGFDPTQTEPTPPIRFTERVPLTGAPPADPARSSGAFYDRRLRRLTGGSSWTNRSEARYRLRYAVVVTDLDGHLLANGDPAVNYRLLTEPNPSDPLAYPPADRVAQAASRVLRSSYQVGHMAMPMSMYGVRDGNYSIRLGHSASGRLEHVFSGRGSTSNFDILPTTRAPVTFPMMFRSGSIQNHQFADTPYVSATSIAGGDPIPSADLRRALVGPQHSFKSFDEAIQGTALEDSGYAGQAYSLGSLTPFGRGLATDRIGQNRNPGDPGYATFGRFNHGRWHGPSDTPWCVNALTANVRVVNAMIAGYMPPGAICAYYQKAPPTGLATSDWPDAETKTIGWQRDFFVKEMSTAFANRSPASMNFSAPARATPAMSPDYRRQLDNRPWFSRYPGPLAYNGDPDNVANGGSTRLSDNLGFYLRAVVRPVATGTKLTTTGRPEVVRSNSAGTWRFKDTSGGRIELQHGPNGEYMGEGFWNSIQANSANMIVGRYAGGDWSSTVDYIVGNYAVYNNVVYRAIANNRNHRPDITPASWTSTSILRHGDHIGEVRGHPDSIWEAVGGAMEAAISVARGMYLQYKGPRFDPTAGNRYFDGGEWRGPVPWAPVGQDTVTWDPAWGAVPRVANIRDIDALFVANLGSNWNSPADPNPTIGWKRNTAAGLTNYVASFTPTYNLAGLRTATTSVKVVAASLAVPEITALAAGVDPISVDLGTPSPVLGTYTFPIMAWNHPDEPRRSANDTTGNPYTDLSYHRPNDAGTYDNAGYTDTQPYPSYSATQRTAICELIINDMRLSLFGCSPGYRDPRPDGTSYFHALDLNGDGVAHCSGFTSSNDPGEIALNLDCYAPAPAGYANREIDHYFSHTGTLFVGKSRYWRICVRGEVWDNVLNNPVNTAQLDSVVVFDPMNEAREWDDVLPGDPDRPDPAKLYSSHIIYQRWIFDSYRGFKPRVAP